MKAFLPRPAALILATLGLWLSPLLAAAQVAQCAGLDQVVEGLEARWQEVPVARGLQSGDLIIMVFASPDGDTWTVIGVGSDGLACLLGSGTGWETLPRPAPGVEG